MEAIKNLTSSEVITLFKNNNINPKRVKAAAFVLDKLPEKGTFTELIFKDFRKEPTEAQAAANKPGDLIATYPALKVYDGEKYVGDVSTGRFLDQWLILDSNGEPQPVQVKNGTYKDDYFLLSERVNSRFDKMNESDIISFLLGKSYTLTTHKAQKCQKIVMKDGKALQFCKDPNDAKKFFELKTVYAFNIAE